MKQAPRAWYDRMDTHLLQLGFSRSQNESTLYVKSCGNHFLIVSIYVEDMLITGNELGMIQEFKDKMKKMFEMSDLRMMNYFLGMEVMQSSHGMFYMPKKVCFRHPKKIQNAGL